MRRPIAWALLGVLAASAACQRPAPDGASTSSAPEVQPATAPPADPTSAPTSPSPATAATATSTPREAVPASAVATSPPTTLGTPPSTSAPASTAPPAPTTDAECLSALPLEWRAAQVLMPAVYGDNLTAAREVIDQLDIGAAILMTWPDGASPDALRELKFSNAVPVLIATDEEGGDVQRLRRIERIPSASEVAATRTPEDAYELIARHAGVVRELGIDVVFAPVVDVAPPGGGGPIGDRTFSDDSLIVSIYATEYVAAWESAGILPVLKHFPGHGRATADSHHGRSATAPIDQLNDELFPYRQLAASGAGVMLGHLDVPGLTDGDLPASLSPRAVAFLRDTLGYADALVFTDALNMDAIADRWNAPQAAVMALLAGADVPLYASLDGSAAIVDAIVAAVHAGTLPSARLDEATTRILRAKGLTPCAALASRGAD